MLQLAHLDLPENDSQGRLEDSASARRELKRSERSRRALLSILEDQKRTQQELRVTNRALKALSAGNEALVRARDEVTLLQETVDILTQIGAYPIAFVAYANDDERKSVVPVACSGIDPRSLLDPGISWSDTQHGQSAVARAIRLGTTQIVRDADRNPAYDPWREVLRGGNVAATLGLPLRLGEKGRVIGAIGIATTDRDAFNAHEIRLLEELAGDLAYGIENLRARIAQQEADDRMRVLARFPEENPNIVIRIDASGVILYANPASADFLQVCGGQVGQSAPVIWGAPAQRAFDASAVKREELTLGGRFYALTFAPVRDAGYLNVYGVDITERRCAEEKLQFSNAVLSAQQETSLDGIYVVDQDHKMVSFNRRFVEMWGLPEDVVETRSDEAALGVVLDNFDSPEEFMQGVRDLYERRDHKLHDELHLKGDRTFERFSSPMVGTDGRYYGRVFYFRDVTERKRAETSLRRALVATIEAIAATVETRDPYTAGHQRRVAHVAAAIAREMGLPEQTVEGIHFGALIHDLGKVQVPAEILAKPTRLTRIEYELIKTHPQAGYDIIKDIAFPWPVAKIVLQHHERLDGTGYPQGLKGDEILPEARILIVADVVEAMSSHRPYRPGKGIEMALQEIEIKRGTWFDPAVVDACLRLFREKGFAFQD